MYQQEFGEAYSDLVTIKFDSCHGSWQFQPARKRFRRLPRGDAFPGASTGWQPYFGLRFDDADGFVVLLNAKGTRLLHSWRHRLGSDPCELCAGRSTDHADEGIHELVG
ncbi:MAG: hypothetical protein ACRDWE_04075 [Acidimicrobiales bacterium]